MISGEFPDALHESGVSSIWSNSYIGKFLSINFMSEKFKERRKLNHLPFNWLLSQFASIEILTCSFVFIFAHFGGKRKTGFWPDLVKRTMKQQMAAFSKSVT